MRQLEDQVADAADAVRLYKLAIKLCILGIVAGLTSAAIGIAVGLYSSFISTEDHVGMVCAFLIPGLIGAAGIGITLGLYLSDHSGRNDPRRELRDANRAYDHYCSKLTNSV